MVSYTQVYSPSGADLQVWGADLPAGDQGQEGGTTAPTGNGGGYIRIHSAYLNGQNGGLVWNIALHEVMHSANFHHSAGGCETQSEMNPSIAPGGPWANGPTGNDYCAADRAWRGDVSPILVAVDGGPIRLSNVANGVWFDIRGIGRSDHVAWPIDATVGFLALDRNGNGVIDNGGELFGNFTRLSSGERADNGYAALAELDDNDDGWIDAADAAYAQLRVWIDLNRDGVSDPNELVSLSSLSIRGLSVRYSESRRTDQWGNEFRYHAAVQAATGGARQTWDVYLRTEPQLSR